MRVAVYRAALINFELNAEMPQALAVEHEIGRVAVLVNDVAMLIPAGCAVSVVVIVPVRAITMDNTPAVITANIIFVKAMLAECVRVILDDILLVDSLGTVVADYDQAICAVLAKPIAFHFKHLVNRMLSTAICTNSCFTHCLFLHFVW